MNSEFDAAQDVVRQLWQATGLPAGAMEYLSLQGNEPAMPSTFPVGTAAQSAIAAAALAAAEFGFARGGKRQRIGVDLQHAALECATHFTIDGVSPNMWDKLSGLYRCDGGRGWVRVHANFSHHRRGVLDLLGLPFSEAITRQDVEKALEHWAPLDFEQQASERGLAVAAVRSFTEWDAHPQAKACASLPLVEITRIGDAAPRHPGPLLANQRPLAGIRALELTRIIAGPVAGRALAAYGAEVMLVNSPRLPNIDAIAETSRGKLSAHLDLTVAGERDQLRKLASRAHVFLQGYRPGGLAALGFSAEDLHRISPGIVYASLSAYGRAGPWCGRRGFDSLVQSATGLNVAEAEGFSVGTPRALPIQILDHATGLLTAFGCLAALIRQQHEGGSWHVQVSLARTSLWLREMGRISSGANASMPSFDGLLEESESGFGRLVAVRHAAGFSETPACYSVPSMPPGSHPPEWMS